MSCSATDTLNLSAKQFQAVFGTNSDRVTEAMQHRLEIMSVMIAAGASRFGNRVGISADYVLWRRHTDTLKRVV